MNDTNNTNSKKTMTNELPLIDMDGNVFEAGTLKVGDDVFAEIWGAEVFATIIGFTALGTLIVEPKDTRTSCPARKLKTAKVYDEEFRLAN